jgi:RNA polymerase sigma factor FliA
MNAARPTLPPRERARVMMTIVNNIARMISLRVPRHVQREELVSAGALGLAEAYTRRGAMSGPDFERFASCRIRGAIIDDLRSRDHVSRGMRRMARALSTAESRARGGESPSNENLARELGVSEDKLPAIRDAQAPCHVDVDPATVADDAMTPEDLVGEKQVLVRVMALTHSLPANQKRAIDGCFLQQRTQKEVAGQLGVSEARVSQMCTQATRTLGALLSEPAEPSAA